MRTQYEPGAGTPTRESTGSEPPTRAIPNLQGSRFRPGAGEGSDRRLLTAEEVAALGRERDPDLAGTSRARYAPWDMTDLAVDELVSHVAVLLEAGAVPWTPANTRHWATWVAFCVLRDLDPRLDADRDRLAAYALAALTNGLAPKTVRDHLRSIVRITESAPPTLQTRHTRAADAQTLTRVWTRLGGVPRRRPAPVVPLGHLLAMARWLRDHDPQGHVWLAATYARALRTNEPLRIVADSVDLDEHVVRVFVERTKTCPEGEWVDIPRLRGWGDDELDVGAALAALPGHAGQHVVELTVDQIAHRLRRAAAATGVTDWSTRTPRRSRATHVLLDGADRDLIQWLLRHDDPRSTSCYIDALWAYAYDTDRAITVLLDPSPPAGGPVAADDVRGPRPVRTSTRLSEFAASAQPTDDLAAQARSLLDEHAPGGTVYSRTYLLRGRRFLRHFDDWCADVLGQTVDLARQDGETALLLHVTARLEGRTPHTANAESVTDQFHAAVALLGRDAPDLARVREALAGARRTAAHRKVPAVAATAAEVAHLLHTDLPDAQAIRSMTVDQRCEALAQARDNVTWAGAFSSASRVADMRQARLDGMVQVPGMGWVAYLAMSKAVRHQPTERDVLVFPDRPDALAFGSHLEVMLALREAAGIDEPWLLARTKPGCDATRPIDARIPSKALEGRRAEVGMPWLTGNSLRHGRIAELADAGRPLEELRRWLRHTDHETVPTYAAQARPGWLWRQVLAAVEQHS